MAKAIKLPDGYYWDSSCISHNRISLNELLTPKVLYSRSKTYANITDNTVINLSDDITKYKKIIIYGINGNGIISNCEIYNPSINDMFVLSIPRSGSRTGNYAYEHDYREFVINSSKEIKYGNGAQGASRLTSNTTWYGFVSDATTVMIYAVIGCKV